MTAPTPPAVSDALREAVARDPRVDTQVWTAAASLSPEQTQQPEWLWFANDGTEGIPVARYSFGRWPKIGSAAPYVRADIPLSGPIASEIARLTGENARLDHNCQEWVRQAAENAEAADRLACRAEAAEAETARLRAERLILDKRIHDQRVALRQNWEITEMRNKDHHRAAVRTRLLAICCRLRAELNTAEAETARLRAVLQDCRNTIANPNPGICCTVWFDGITTLQDHIDLALAVNRPPQPEPPLLAALTSQEKTDG